MTSCEKDEEIAPVTEEIVVNLNEEAAKDLDGYYDVWSAKFDGEESMGAEPEAIKSANLRFDYDYGIVGDVKWGFNSNNGDYETFEGTYRMRDEGEAFEFVGTYSYSGVYGEVEDAPMVFEMQVTTDLHGDIKLVGDIEDSRVIIEADRE